MNKRKEYVGDKRLLSIEEAAAYIGMGKVRTRSFMNEINASRKFGGRVLFDKNIIDSALDGMTDNRNEVN